MGIEKIGVEDNFFELGGNSFLAMRMTAYIERTLGHHSHTGIIPGSLYKGSK